MKSDGGDSNDDGGVGDVGEDDTNVCDDVNCGDGDNKFDCGDNLDSADGDNKDDCVVDDDGVDSNICNDVNCGDGKSKVDFCEDTAGDDSNSNADGGPNNDGVGDTNDYGRDGDDVNGESNDSADGHKMIIKMMMVDVLIL